jgi:hypothetical protein
MRGSVGITTVLVLVGAGAVMTAFAPWAGPSEPLVPSHPLPDQVCLSPAGLALLAPAPTVLAPTLPPMISQASRMPAGPDVTAMLAQDVSGAVEELSTPAAPVDVSPLAMELKGLIDCFVISD